MEQDLQTRNETLNGLLSTLLDELDVMLDLTVKGPMSEKTADMLAHWTAAAALAKAAHRLTA